MPGQLSSISLSSLTDLGRFKSLFWQLHLKKNPQTLLFELFTDGLSIRGTNRHPCSGGRLSQAGFSCGKKQEAVVGQCFVQNKFGKPSVTHAGLEILLSASRVKNGRTELKAT